MNGDQAAWVREHVWPRQWLSNYDHIPGTFLHCACQKPPSVACQRDAHSQCRHDGHPINETVIQTNVSRAARFTEPHAHPSPVRSGTNDLAWVWLTGRPCRQLCNCYCHTTAPAPQAFPAVSVQLDLFAGAAA